MPIRSRRRAPATLAILAAACLLGACGLDAELGVTAHDPAEAEVKRAMAAASRRIVVAATTDKLGTAAPFSVAPAAAIDELVVERDAPAALLAGFAGHAADVATGPPLDLGLEVRWGIGALAALLLAAGLVMLIWRTPEVDGLRPGQPGFSRKAGLISAFTASAHRPRTSVASAPTTPVGAGGTVVLDRCSAGEAAAGWAAWMGSAAWVVSARRLSPAARASSGRAATEGRRCRVIRRFRSGPGRRAGSGQCRVAGSRARGGEWLARG